MASSLRQSASFSLDAIVMIHAGTGAEMTGSNDDIWSHKWVLAGGARAVDRTKIYGYLTVPEDCKIGVCAHELGHLLFGFPDLYDTDASSEGIGNWCLMAAGSWGSGGDVPVHPSAWCKANQGWATVNVVETDGAITVTEVKTSNTVYRLWMNAMGGNEYFLIENRQQIGFDASLPAGGLLIWHIDDGQPTNTDENHYKVALMQADGKRDLEHDVNRADAGDPYPGSSNNRTFNATSNPSSKSYANADSLVAVTSISASGPAMTMQVQVKLQSGSVLTAFSQAGGPNLYRVHWSADGTQLGSSWPLYEGATRVVTMIPYKDGVLTAAYSAAIPAASYLLKLSAYAVPIFSSSGSMFRVQRSDPRRLLPIETFRVCSPNLFQLWLDVDHALPCCCAQRSPATVDGGSLAELLVIRSICRDTRRA